MNKISREVTIFVLLVLLALAVSGMKSLKIADNSGSNHHLALPAWPVQFEGKKLVRLKLSSREKYFLGGFPGKVARFTDGNRQIIMRRVLIASRKLHPAVDCFRGLGYKISDIKIVRDKKMRLWRKFNARNSSINLSVSEQIIDKSGKVFTDTSTWYWNALFNKSQGPWLSITVAEMQPDQ